MMTAAALDRTDLVARLATLRAARPGLALRAARGDDDARDDLARVDAAISEAERDFDILILAGQETARLAVAQAERDAAEERRRLEAAFAAAEMARTAAYVRVEETLDELIGHVRDAMAAARELDTLGSALGQRPATAPTYATAGQVAARIVGRLGADAGLRGVVPPVDGSRPLTGGASS